jgi:hypothetical protein
MRIIERSIVNEYYGFDISFLLKHNAHFIYPLETDNDHQT